MAVRELCIFGLLVSMTLSVSVVRADDAAARAAGFPQRTGLSGFQDLVDGRLPKVYTTRGGLRGEFSHERRRFNGQRRFERDLDINDGKVFAGVSLDFGRLRYWDWLDFDGVEFGGAYSYRELRLDRQVANGTPLERERTGRGDLEVSGKLTFSCVGNYLHFSPYVLARAPLARTGVELPANLEYGGAFSLVTCPYLVLHGNLAGFQEEGGVTALSYRGGLSIPFPIAPRCARTVLFRVYGYWDGLRFEGGRQDQGDAEFGIQAVIVDSFFIEGGVSLRVLDSDFQGPQLRRDLRTFGIGDRHSETTRVGVSVVIGMVF